MTFTNTTGAALTFRATNPVTITGTNAGNFAVTNNACTGTIATGASCVISVTFTPSAMNPRSAALNVFAQGGGAITDSLTGTGT